MPNGCKLNISPTNYHLLAAHQEPYKKLCRGKKSIKKKSGEWKEEKRKNPPPPPPKKKRQKQQGTRQTNKRDVSPKRTIPNNTVKNSIQNNETLPIIDGNDNKIKH